jgi:hypothetical protein
MKIEKYEIKFANGIVQEKYMIPNGVEFFTEKSPLGEAVKTGKLVLPITQGGTTDVTVTKINSVEE